MALSEDQQTVLMIKGAIASLSAEQHRQCMELYNKVVKLMSDAPDPLGTLVIALIGAEMQAQSTK